MRFAYDYFRAAPHKKDRKRLVSLPLEQQKGSGLTGAFNKNQKETVTKYYLK
jgi:hypothetical protein